MFSSCLTWGAGRGPLPRQWAVEALCSCLWGPAKANGVGTGRRVVLTNPQTTLPSGGAPLLGLIVVARQRPGVKVPLFQAFLPCGGICFLLMSSVLCPVPGGITEGLREPCAQGFSRSHSHTSQTTNQGPQPRQEELPGLWEQKGDGGMPGLLLGGCCTASGRAFLPGPGLPLWDAWISGLSFWSL